MKNGPKRGPTPRSQQERLADLPTPVARSTEALVSEQRTANLIAVLGLGIDCLQAGRLTSNLAFTPTQLVKVRNEINERLGLDDV
ncbi:hypothetical protein GCM10022234_00630 [Aeromicrobium panaciterrae]|uniref:hypothetical protein n=1 Tax=Aeromicrobium panaciterrae TaxID=363861 RepID=UPI0031E36BA7